MRKERINLLFGGMAGFISVAVIQLLTIDPNKIDQLLIFALFCFSLTLPLSVFLVVATELYLVEDKNKKDSKAPAWYMIIGTLVLIIGFIGIAALFYHFNSVFAIIFSITSLIVLGVIAKLDKDLQALQSVRNISSKTKKKKSSAGKESKSA